MESFRKPDKNRIRAAFNHETPDRVPNFEVLVDNPTLSAIMGREIKGGHTLANIDPLDYCEFADKTGQDVIGMCFYDNPFRYLDDNGKLQQLDFKITDRKDLNRLLPLSLDHLEPRFTLLDRYQEILKGSSIGLFVLTGDFMCTTYDSIFGFENFMYMLYDDRDLIEEVLERYAGFYESVVKRLLEYDLTFLYIGDDVAYKSGTIISPAMLRELWMPRMKRIMGHVKSRKTPLLYHSDGNILEIIPDLLDAGVDALNPIEPYGMDISEIKKKFGRNLTLVGNLDVGGNLSMGTQESVRREAEALIDAVGKDGGLVLASSHSITRNVKPENYLAMIDTAQTYGVYRK